jgi:PEP-CTERM motif
MGRSKIISSIPLLLALCLNAHAASLLVAPNANAGVNGSTVQYGVLGNGDDENITFQYDISASQLTPMVGASVTALGFRLPGGSLTIGTISNVGPYSLELSGSLNPIGSLNPNPANNIAPGGVTVYSSSLVIPANSLIGGPGPNPFYLINFSTPYLYSGGNLLVTLTNTAQVSIPVDANVVDSIVDTAACFGSFCQAEYFNYPITEFQYGTPTIPEPSTIALVGSGLLGVAGIARRRFKL